MIRCTIQKTLPDALQQYERLTGKQAKDIFLDRGYRGPKIINQTNLNTPKPNPNITKSKRNKHKRRAAIEPTIGHLKHDYRMIRNYLKGAIGDEMNVMLSAAAMNFKRVMNIWKQGLKNFIEFFCLLIIGYCSNFFTQKLKQTF
jgi:IS5 family transposase